MNERTVISHLHCRLHTTVNTRSRRTDAISHHDKLLWHFRWEKCERAYKICNERTPVRPWILYTFSHHLAMFRSRLDDFSSEILQRNRIISIRRVNCVKPRNRFRYRISHWVAHTTNCQFIKVYHSALRWLLHADWTPNILRVSSVLRRIPFIKRTYQIWKYFISRLPTTVSSAIVATDCDWSSNQS